MRKLKKTSKDFILFNRPDIGEQEIQEISHVMRSGWIGTGPVTKEFETKFSEFVDGRPCVAVNSATTGLILALKALGIGAGQKVITTPLTFAATVNAILTVGAKPVLVDVDQRGCIDPKKIETFLKNDYDSHQVRAILPVHYSGSSCDMDKIMRIAKKNDLVVIEDCAHAFGGFDVKGRKIGTRGDASVFSFYANKNITTGEGGMVACKKEEIAERVKMLSNQGQSSGAWMRYSTGPVLPYHIEEPGFKGNLPDILSVIGVVQLYRWPEMKARRKEIFSIYEHAFGKKDRGHSTHFYEIRVKNRDEMRLKLNKLGVGTGIHYTPLHLEPAYEFLRYKKGDFPVAEKIGRETLSLPVSPTMTAEDAHRVVEAVES